MNVPLSSLPLALPVQGHPGNRSGRGVFVIVRGRPSYYPSVNRHSATYLGVFLVGAAVLAPEGALAAGSGRLQYAAPSGCPTQAEFEQAVAAREVQAANCPEVVDALAVVTAI